MSIKHPKKWYEIVAHLLCIEVNPDKETVECVLGGLENNKAKYGCRFCPCELEHDMDKVCPCKKLREEGICRCMLFIVPKSE